MRVCWSFWYSCRLGYQQQHNSKIFQKLRVHSDLEHGSFIVQNISIAERSWFEENTFCCQMFIFNFSKLFSRFYWIFASEEFYNVSCAWRNRLPANILSLLSEKLFLRVVFKNQNKIPQKEAELMIRLNWFMSPIPETRFSSVDVNTKPVFSITPGHALMIFFFFARWVSELQMPSLSFLALVIMLTFTIPFTFPVDSPRTLKSRCDKSPLGRTLLAGCRMKNCWRRSRQSKR